MFDKNQFKQDFRLWMVCHRGLDPQEVREWCLQQLEPGTLQSHHWLVDQCVQWYQWVEKERKKAHIEWDPADEVDEGLLN